MLSPLQPWMISKACMVVSPPISGVPEIEFAISGDWFKNIVKLQRKFQQLSVTGAWKVGDKSNPSHIHSLIVFSQEMVLKLFENGRVLI